MRGVATSPLCGKCPFARNGAPYQPVVGDGADKPLFIVVGEGPGEAERRTQKPFQGPSGQLLNRALEGSGLSREPIYVTNALNCTPPGASDSAKEAARLCCAPRLATELESFAGVPIVTLGAIATRSVLGSDVSMTQVAGTGHNVDGRWVVPTYHPAYILRGGAGDAGGAHSVDLLWWALLFDINKIARIANGQAKPFSDNVEIEYEDAKRAEKLIESAVYEIRKARAGAIDLETDHDPENPRPMIDAKIIAVGLATAERAVSVSWRLLTARAKRLLRSYLGDAQVTRVAHNVIFERTVLRANGFPLVDPIADTMLLHHNIFPGLPHDLQRVASQFFLVPSWKSEFRSGEGTEPELLKYNGRDALLTAMLYQVLAPLATKLAVDVAYRHDIEDAKLASDLHTNGIPIDLKINAKLDSFFAENVRVADEQLQARVKEVRSAWLDKLALEKAKGRRKSDHLDFQSRYLVRRAELERKPCGPCRATGQRKRLVCPSCEAKTCVRVWFDCSTCGQSKLFAKTKAERKCSTCALALNRGQVITYCRACERELPAHDKCRDCDGVGGVQRNITFKPNSSSHVVALVRALGHPLVIETAKGKTSTKREILEGMRHINEVDLILEAKSNHKLRSTFVVAVRKKVKPETGCVHPSINVHRITGRWAMQKPSMMNWPKASKKRNRPNLRSQIVAPEGETFVGFDFDKQEGRGIALLSGEPYLLGIFNSKPEEQVKFGPSDFHSVFARMVWPKEYDTIEVKARDELRDFIKRTVYGAFYDGSPEVLWRNLIKDDPKVKIEDVGLVIQIVRSRCATVQRWHGDLMRQVVSPPHELRSLLLNARRVFPLGNASPTDVANWPVQRLGAELMKIGMRKIASLLSPSSKLVMQLHDAATWRCPVSEVESLKAVITTAFTQTYTHPIGGWTVEFPIEVKSGRSMAEV